MKLRETNIKKLKETTFDVLILGGGINGAVSASALAAQGAKVALIDKGDFASATSQESSNLAWGGIKYMETMEFGLVRKLCTSRNHLIKSYPSTVKEIRFFVTLKKGFRFNRFILFAGSWLYWLIGNLFTQRPRLLSTKKIKLEQQQINVTDATGGFEYSDAFLIDNDARFVISFIRDALNRGAVIANYIKAANLAWSEGGLWHTEAEDQETGEKFEILSRTIINATGPWVDQNNKIMSITTGMKHVFSKGIHLIVPRITQERKILTFFASDGRLFFVIPMGNKSCIGTTDTKVDKIPPIISDEDRNFILDNINNMLSLEKKLTAEDIIAERCGVRPLVVTDEKKQGNYEDWASLSRKHIISVNKDHPQISIYGGKLTDCINIGNEVLDLIKRLGIDIPENNKKWYGEPHEAIKNEFFHQAKLMSLDEMTSPESSEVLSTRLWRRYGATALVMLEDIRQDPNMAEVLIKGTEYIRTEIHHAAKSEMITELEDFLRRRSKISLIATKETVKNAPGLKEACYILFKDKAEEKIEAYFKAHT